MTTLSFEEAVLATYGVIATVLLIHYASMPLHSPLEDAKTDDHTKHRVGVLIELSILAGIAYDNFILSLGRMIRTHPHKGKRSKKPDLLRLLSWPRFFLHSALLPLNFVSLALLGQREGVTWLASDNVILVIAILSGFLSAYGVYESFLLKLIPAKNGVVRYRIDGPGAFVGVAVAIGVTLFAIVVGSSMWLAHPREYGVLFGGILTLGLASLPGRFAMVLANLGELVFLITQIVAWVEL